MTEFELELALTQVKDHFKGAKVTQNTVLAAHIRALGATPTGDVWDAAKALLSDGHSFHDSARRAVDNYAEVEMRSDDSESDAEDATTPAPDLTLLTPGQRGNPQASSEYGGGHLDWFPKRFGPGDIDGEGARKLLGTPNIAVVSVLVRETAQNSWDARDGSHDVAYELHLRELDAQAVALLRDEVFTGDCAGLRLRETLSQSSLWCLEVVDRGTTGLDGPTRNDLVIPDDVPTNYIDLVLNIGAPRDVELGGGTYGFGKTVAYTTSSCGTVVIWSRSREAHGLEHRIIGSAIGDNFDAGEFRYTGRHWWGKRLDDRVEPLVGDAAAALGGAVFDRGFEGDEAGTSILILDPDLGGETPEHSVMRLQQAITWHLWPKLLEARNADTAMNMSVLLNGQELEMPDIAGDTILGGFTATLRALRAVQAGSPQPDEPFPVTVLPISSERPKKLLGHLALTRWPVSAQQIQRYDDVAAFSGMAHHVALMRHSAELVVKYQSGPPLETDGVQWAGVFKPVAAVDDSFARSEPPAHDDWLPQSLQDKHQARDVRIALHRIRDAVAEFVLPFDRQSETVGDGPSVAGIADALADLIPSIDGPRNTPRPSTPHGSTPRRPTPKILGHKLGSDLGGRRLSAYFVKVDGASDTTTVRATCAVGVEGGSDPSADDAFIAGWTRDTPDLEILALDRADNAHKVPVAGTWLIINSLAEVAVDVQVELGD